MKKALTCGFIVGVMVAVVGTFGQSSYFTSFLGILARNVNQVRMCDQMPGAGTYAKITRCIADLPPRGGTADARGIEGIQTLSQTIVIDKPVKLLIGATVLNFTGTVAMVQLVSPGASLECTAPSISVFVAPVGVDGVQISGSNTAVRNCELRGPGTISNGNSGIEGGTASSVSIENNLIDRWSDGAINTGATASGWNVVHNFLNDNYGAGFFGPSSYHNVQANVMRDNGVNAIDLNGSHNVIAGNNLYRNGYRLSSTDCWGILLAAVPGRNSDYNVVTGNVIDATNCQGIILKAFTAQSVSFNTVTANTVTGATAVNGDGITIDGTSGGTLNGNAITANIVRANARHGIVADGTAATVTNTIVAGNYIAANVGTGLLATGAGSTGMTATANIIVGNGVDVDLTNTGASGNVNAGNQTTGGDGGFYFNSPVGMGITAGAYGMLDIRSGAACATSPPRGLYFGETTNGWFLCEQVTAALSLKTTSSGIPAADRVTIQSSGAVKALGRIVGGDVVTFADGDTTPSVLGANVFAVSNTAATSITALDDCLNGQPVELLFTTGNTTLVNSSTLHLERGANTKPAANTAVAFSCSASEAWQSGGRLDGGIQAVASAATITPNSDAEGMVVVTALATGATIASPSGSPAHGQTIMLRVKDNGTSRALTFNAIYRASSDLALPAATTLSKTLYLLFVYNATDTKWDLIAKLDNF